jgi:hypothetical protein
MTRCHYCRAELGWDAHDDALPEGETIFVRQRNVPGELGVETRYYCSVECLSQAAGSQPASSPRVAPR